MRNEMKAVLSLSVFCLLLSACGREDFGDFFIRVWFEQTIETGDCAGAVSSSSTIYDALTAVVYEGEGNVYYLDIEDDVLEGAKTGDNYNFTGQETFGTQTLTVTVDFDVSGDDVTGTMIVLETDTGYNCTETTQFSGVKVDDVELRYSM